MVVVSPASGLVASVPAFDEPVADPVAVQTLAEGASVAVLAVGPFGRAQPEPAPGHGLLDPGQVGGHLRVDARTVRPRAPVPVARHPLQHPTPVHVLNKQHHFNQTNL